MSTTTDLMEAARQGDLDTLELTVLEAAENGALDPAALTPALEAAAGTDADRAAALAQMVLEQIDVAAHAREALRLVRLALAKDPRSESLRQRAIAAARGVWGDREGFEALLEASGLAGSRPPRAALRTLELCLTLRAGTPLLNRAEQTIAEIVQVDPAHALYTIRIDGRQRTLPAVELARDFEPIEPDDFRVLRALHPERLSELIEHDPAAVAVGLLRAAGGELDSDALKHELVPRHIPARAWSKWWQRCREALKKHPRVALEGRSPVRLRLREASETVESALRDAFVASDEPARWQALLDEYLRRCKAEKREPDRDTLAALAGHVRSQLERVTRHGPAIGLHARLLLARIGELTGDPQAAEPLATWLRETPDIAAALRDRDDRELWQALIARLPHVERDDWPRQVAALIEIAPPAVLTPLVELALRRGLSDQVQARIDAAVADPLDYPALVAWLWSGPQRLDGLRLPGTGELFELILDVLVELDRAADSGDAGKRFRQLIRPALRSRDYARVREALTQVSAERAVTLKPQLERLGGLGPNIHDKLVGLLRELHPQLWRVETPKVQPWEDPNVIWATQAGIDRKTAERDELVNVKMRENARRIGEAAAHGDLSENSEYKFALEERDLLRARLARINQELSLARRIEPHQVPTDYVGIGSRIVLKNPADGTTREMTFLGPFETDVERGVYNYRAPVAAAVLGKRVGERVKLLIDGREVEFEIVQITNGLLAD